MDTTEQKTERNCRAQARYDELMRDGKHGHYETMFRVVREEVEAERERCATICESRIDDREQARAALAAAKALAEGSTRDKIGRLSHEGTVHLYNRTLQRCADEIRDA